MEKSDSQNCKACCEEQEFPEVKNARTGMAGDCTKVEPVATAKQKILGDQSEKLPKKYFDR